MTKIGPILAIISGIFTITFGILLLLNARGVLESDFFGKYINSEGIKTYSNSAAVVYGITIAIGFFMVILGYFSFKKSRGISSFILLALFAATVTLTIIGATRAHTWPIATIIQLVIQGIATIGLVMGFVRGNK